MGHSEGDVVHKIPNKMKTHGQNLLKILIFVYFNRSQLAKMKKEYSWHVPAMKFIGRKQLV